MVCRGTERGMDVLTGIRAEVDSRSTNDREELGHSDSGYSSRYIFPQCILDLKGSYVTQYIFLYFDSPARRGGAG